MISSSSELRCRNSTYTCFAFACRTTLVRDSWTIRKHIVSRPEGSRICNGLATNFATNPDRCIWRSILPVATRTIYELSLSFKFLDYLVVLNLSPTEVRFLYKSSKKVRPMTTETKTIEALLQEKRSFPPLKNSARALCSAVLEQVSKYIFYRRWSKEW